MNKSVDNTPIETSDNPSEFDFFVNPSILELEEMLEQRLGNKPQGEISLKQWRRDINDLVDELNTNYGYSKFSKV